MNYRGEVRIPSPNQQSGDLLNYILKIAYSFLSQSASRLGEAGSLAGKVSTVVIQSHRGPE